MVWESQETQVRHRRHGMTLAVQVVLNPSTIN